ncbi:MAG: hypothetical protein K2P19_14485, partial [Kineothrix sp.]|nr:hypothetical protein [Kineothrix sp.]
MQMGEHDRGVHKVEVGGIPRRVGTANQRRRCELAAYYSEYYPGWGNLNQNQKDRYHFAAQAIIWETMHGLNKNDVEFYYNKNNAPYGNKNVRDWVKIDISDERRNIEAKIKAHDTKPSFDGQTFEVWKDSSKDRQVLELYDTNGVLSGYEVVWITSEFKNIAIDGNKLKVVLSDYAPIGQTFEIQLWRYYAKTGNRPNVYYSSSTLQDLFKFGQPNVMTTVKIKYNSKGTVTIRKVDDAGNPVPGVTFRYGTHKNMDGQPVNGVFGAPSITAPTNANGYTTITMQPADVNIHIQEYSVPAHLEKDTTVKTV